MRTFKLTCLIIAVGFSSVAISAQSLDALKKEGERDGKRYAEDSRKNGIKADKVACAVGMSAEDKSRPELSQTEIEAYAKAFGNACLGRDVF